MKKRALTLFAICFLMMAFSATSAFAWGTASANCVAGSYGQAAVGAGATDPMEVFYCNIFNAITGGVGATIAVCMIVGGIVAGAFGNGGVMSAVPFVILGLVLGLSDTIIGWLGVTTRVVPKLLL